MKLVPALCFCLLASSAPAFEIDELFDRLDAALTVAAFHDNFRARLSGTIDLEVYNFEQPAPGLIDSSIDNLFNPRLTLFLDAQLGSQIYFFTQTRLDRGFTLQLGKFATVVGNWVPRHLPWDNPFVNAPLVYENITAISDKTAPYSAYDFVFRMQPYEKYAFNPLIWGPSYATGVSVSGQ